MATINATKLLFRNGQEIHALYWTVYSLDSSAVCALLLGD